MTASKQGSPVRGPAPTPNQRISAALAERPTARGHWELLCPDDDRGARPPDLVEDAEYHVITAAGFAARGEWVRSHGCTGFEVDGEPAAVKYVWIPSRSGPSGKAEHPLINVRAPRADQDRYRAKAAAAGLTYSEWVRRALEMAP